MLVLHVVIFFLQYEGLFRFCAENSVDNAEMFSLLLSSAYAEPRPFLFLVLLQHLGDTISLEVKGRAEPNFTKGFSILYDIILSV